jgi:hypothetical protein
LRRRFSGLDVRFFYSSFSKTFYLPH